MSVACPHCGQSLPEARFGVRLTPLKARILDAIARGGPDGIDADTLFWLIYPDTTISRRTLKAHVWQINDELTMAGAGVFIDGKPGRASRYTLRQGERPRWPDGPLFDDTTPPTIEHLMLRIGTRMRELQQET